MKTLERLGFVPVERDCPSLNDAVRQVWRENSFLRIAVGVIGLACLTLIGWALVCGAFILGPR
jgi:hypothetical protein